MCSPYACRMVTLPLEYDNVLLYNSQYKKCCEIFKIATMTFKGALLLMNNLILIKAYNFLKFPFAMLVNQTVFPAIALSL